MKKKVLPPSLFRFCAYDKCGKQLPDYEYYPSRRRRFRGLFCNVKCHGLSLRGKARNNKNKQGKHHIRIRVNGDRVYLHRQVFEQHHRPLKEGEIVHHRDDYKFNNDPDNLEALEDRAEHAREHYRNGSGMYRSHGTEKLIDGCDF